MLREELYNITTDSLFKTGKISARAYHVCENGQLMTLGDIIDYYKDEGNFYGIRNSGKKTCLELETLCKDIISQLRDESIYSSEINKIPFEIRELQCIYENLTDEQKELLNTLYNRELKTLDSRSLKIVGKWEFTDYYRKVVRNYNFSFSSYYSIGTRTIKKLDIFKVNMINHLKRVAELSNQSIILESAILKYGDFCTLDIIFEFLDKFGHLPMFWVLEKQLKESKERNIDILQSYYGFYSSDVIVSLDEIARKYSITRERARQIRNDSFNDFFSINSNYFQFKEDWREYELFKNTDIVLQDFEVFINCKKEENTDFSVEFIMQILSILFPDKVVLFGGYETARKKTWHNTFLINKELVEIFDFEKLREYFSDMLSEPIDEEYFFNLEEYLGDCLCWKVFTLEKQERIIEVIKEIFLYEFNLYADLDGMITIPVNKVKHPSVIVYEILKQRGNPMHLEDIFVEFKKLQPEHKYTNPAQLRPTLLNHEAITCINRSSTYALKEWKHIKTGTIRDTIIEYLLAKNTPCNAEEITDYVCKYFDTNISSIRTTMYCDGRKRFSFFKEGLFGLATKDYPAVFELSDGPECLRLEFNKRLYDLERFVVKNGHFPFCSGCEDEKSLHRWWGLTLTGKKKLDEGQLKEVERILNDYKECLNIDKRYWTWKENFNKLKCFLLENKNLPDARGNETEKALYGWWQRVKKDFVRGELTLEQKNLYIELCKLMAYA